MTSIGGGRRARSRFDELEGDRYSASAVISGVVVVSVLVACGWIHERCRLREAKKSTRATLRVRVWDRTRTRPRAAQLCLKLVYMTGWSPPERQEGDTVISPELATSWTTSSDGLMLGSSAAERRQGFQDGTPFNAAAVKANIDPGEDRRRVDSRTSFKSIDSVEVVNDSTRPLPT